MASSPYHDSEVVGAIDSARRVLEAFTIAQYLEERQRAAPDKHWAGRRFPSAVTVDPGMQLGDILRLLSKHGILSAPVVEKVTGRFSGFVDVAGILAMFTQGCRRWLVLGRAFIMR